jgi:hypothetical protein
MPLFFGPMFRMMIHNNTGFLYIAGYMFHAKENMNLIAINPFDLEHVYIRLPFGKTVDLW